MVAEVRERSIAETVFGALEKTGASTRSTLYNIFAEDTNAPAIGDIMAGRDTFSAKEFIEKIEDSTGLDITAGGRAYEDQTATDVAINTVRDIAVDIATSPETYIPFAAAARATGLTKKTIGNPLVRKSLRRSAKAFGKSKNIPAERSLNLLAKTLNKAKVQDRIVTGATLGALSINEEDSLLKSAIKVGGGGALGFGASKAFDKAGEVGQKFGGKVTNKLLDFLGEKSFKKANTDERLAGLIRKHFDGNLNISNVLESTKKSGDEIKDMSRLFLDSHNELEQNIIKQMKTEGHGDDVIESLLQRLEEIKGGAFSDTTAVRETIHNFLKGKQHNGSISPDFNVLRAATLMANKMINLKFLGRDITEQAFKKGRKIVKSDNILNQSELNLLEGIQDKTVKSLINRDQNIKSIGLMDITKEPTMHNALQKVVANNREVVDQLSRRFRGSGREELIFPGWDFYAVDLRNLDEVVEENLHFSVKEGAHKRFSDNVAVAGDKETREFAKDVGAMRFAAHTLTEPQILARKVLAGVYDEISQASLKRANEGLRQGKIDEILKFGFKAHGQVLSAIKTNHLVTSTNWVKNNYFDNVFKAYMAGGVGNAIESAVEIPAGTLKTLVKKVGLAEDVKNASAFKEFSTSGEAFTDIFTAGKPNKMRKIINHDNKFLKAAADLGVIERSNRFANINKDIITDMHLMDGLDNPLKLMSKSKSNKVDVVKLTAKKNAEILERYTTALWNGPIGRYGVAMEDSMRMVTWKNVMKSFKKEYKNFKEALKIVDGDPTKIIQKTNQDFLNSFKHTIHTKKEIRDALNESLIETTKGMGRPLTKEEVRIVINDTFTKMNRANNEAYAKLLKSSKTDKLIEARKLMEKSAKIVENSFFDYSDVTAFDQFLLKNIFPYWTYLSKSMNYAVDKMFDPEGLRRISGFNKIRSNLGRKPTPEERLGMSQFLLNKDARISPSGEDTVNTPNFSILDNLSTLDPNELANKISPILKTPASLIFNKNFFTGRDLRPSQAQPKVRVFEGKETLLPEVAQAAINFVRPGTLKDDEILNSMNVFRNKAGNLYTNSPSIINTIEVTRNLLPFPLLDAFARSVRNTLHRGDKSEHYLKNSKKLGKELVRDLVVPVQVRPLDTEKLKKRAKSARNRIKKFEADTSEEFFKDNRRKNKLKFKKRRKRRKVL